MPSAILSGNLPTLVPPNFCTTQPRELGFFNNCRAISGLSSDNGGLIDSEFRVEMVKGLELPQRCSRWTKKGVGLVQTGRRPKRRPNDPMALLRRGRLLLFVVEDRGRATVDDNAQRGRGCFFNDESGVFDLDGNQKKARQSRSNQARSSKDGIARLGKGQGRRGAGYADWERE